jgi:ATP-dependent protease HslVU (ClpYQ) peptidase subunit
MRGSRAAGVSVTALVGIARGGSVCIAADSAVTEEDDEEQKSDRLPKVFTVLSGSYAVGCSGDMRTVSLLRYTVDWPPVTTPLAKLITVDVVEAIRKVVRERDDDKIEFGVLIGVRGRLFELGASYDVIEPRPTRAALGTGGAWALGALDALIAERPKMPLRVLAKRALQISAARCISVCEPFRYVVV